MRQSQNKKQTSKRNTRARTTGRKASRSKRGQMDE